jgi:ABC-type Fe3+ transport system permease subunit
MNETTRRIAPVLASIAIIIAIAVLRDRSKALAAITATMPVNVALALWLMAVADDADQATVVSFTQSMMAGVLATLVWLLAVWLGARAGWGLGRLYLVGYAAWGVVIGVAYLLQSLLGAGPGFPR